MSEAEIERYSATVEPADGSGLRLYFNRVPQPKVVKDRIHLDLEAADRPATVRRLIALGATHVRDVEDVFGSFSESWTVMQDPEGNEFCVQTPAVDYRLLT